MVKLREPKCSLYLVVVALGAFGSWCDPEALSFLFGLLAKEALAKGLLVLLQVEEYDASTVIQLQLGKLEAIITKHGTDSDP